MRDGGANDAVRVADDVCALPLARRMAALLDRDPHALREGDPLPRGWHTMLFNVPTRQSRLRADGVADLGVALPDLGLPRLMLAGRACSFRGDLPIGARVRRESRSAEPQLKTGRSGRFALVRVEHRLTVEGGREPVVVEHQDYVMREPARVADAAPAPPVQAAAAPADADDAAQAVRTLVPDEALLFRYSALTDNPHRIHYDLQWATRVEGYPALVVNGSIAAMFLLEMLREAAGREPSRFESRNLAPMYCGRPLRLCLRADGEGFRLWARDDAGTVTFDAKAG